MTTKEKEKVNPIKLTDTATGDTYVLEFDRESVKFADSRGFYVGELTDIPQTRVEELFFYSFRKNHKNVARANTDRIMYEVLKGLHADMVTRLCELYAQPMNALVRTEGELGNDMMTVEM